MIDVGYAWLIAIVVLFALLIALLVWDGPRSRARSRRRLRGHEVRPGS